MVQQPSAIRNYNTGTSGTSGTSTGTSGTYGSTGTSGMATTPTSLKCWHCEADSYELCGQTGYEEQCHANQVGLTQKLLIELLYETLTTKEDFR